jgi:CPA2 family monovalent cation:H+ antiporter-2
MAHLPGLIYDLALILITGAVTTILFRIIKQPVVLGYIIAGFLVGPHLSLTPTVADTENIEIWAEIGVVFLLFSLGLEFSFRKLKRVGGSASITAVFEIVIIFVAGYLLGKFLEWTNMDSIFLGGMLASSSTTIISKAFEELGVKTRNYAGVVIGVLIVEDLLVILLMVLLSTLAATKEFEGMDLIFTIGKLLFFLILWFIGGIFLIPTILSKARKYLSDESTLILSIGLCLGMVVLATTVGFSAELGAFLMGSILAETVFSEKIEHLIKPVKDLFGAIFFISVGMMIDPQVMYEYRWPIIWVSLLVIVGKLLATSAGALVSGQPVKQSVQVGMSMAQVGEFAFIVASLGLSLGVISDFLFPVAVGVSAITTFTTPYMIKSSEGAYKFVSSLLPDRWMQVLNNYSYAVQGIQAGSTLRQVINKYLTIVLINGIVVVAVFMAAIRFLLPFLEKNISGEHLPGIITFIVSLGIATPFLWAIMAKRPARVAYRELWLDRKYSRGPLFIIEISRIILGILIIGYLLDRLFSPSVAVIIGLPVILVTVILFSTRTRKFYNKIELRFIDNLKANERSGNNAEQSGSVLSMQLRDDHEFKPWDVHIVEMQVNPNAAFLGKTLEELGWRERYGINISCIRRGNKFIFAPGRNDRVQAFDFLGIIGTDEQIQTFRNLIDSPGEDISAQLNTGEIVIGKIIIESGNKLRGQSIRNSGIRENTKGLVIGIERDKKRILNPSSDTVFEWGDIVWIAGDRESIQKYK